MTKAFSTLQSNYSHNQEKKHLQRVAGILSDTSITKQRLIDAKSNDKSSRLFDGIYDTNSALYAISLSLLFVHSIHYVIVIDGLNF